MPSVSICPEFSVSLILSTYKFIDFPYLLVTSTGKYSNYSYFKNYLCRLNKMFSGIYFLFSKRISLNYSFQKIMRTIESFLPSISEPDVIFGSWKITHNHFILYTTMSFVVTICLPETSLFKTTNQISYFLNNVNNLVFIAKYVFFFFCRYGSLP